MGTTGTAPVSVGDWVQQGGGLVWRRVFPGRADQVSSARRFAKLLLTDTGRGEDAEWIAAELISNALLHTRSGEFGGWFGLEVKRAAHARVAVYDMGGGGVPMPRPEPTDGTLPAHGHGLRGVDRLAVRMGVEGSSAHGHLVWAELLPRALTYRWAS